MTIEAPVLDPQALFNELRRWIVEHCHAGNGIRNAAYQMAITAAVHRLIKFGPDQTLNHYRARDLMNLLIYTNGLMAEYLMRTAYFRAIVEGDHPIYEKLNETLFMPECRAWYWRLTEAIMGQAPDPDDVTAWVDGMAGEEKSIARLMIARVYPDTAHTSWLDDIPEGHHRLAAELCRCLLRKSRDYRSVVDAYLRDHPDARYCVPEAVWATSSSA